MKKIDWIWLVIYCLAAKIFWEIMIYLLVFKGELEIAGKIMGYSMVGIFIVLLLIVKPWHTFFWQREPQRFYSKKQAKQYCQIRQNQWLYVLAGGGFSLVKVLINRNEVIASGLDIKIVTISFMTFAKINWQLVCYWLLAGVWLLSTMNHLHWVPSNKINGECH